MLLLEADRVIHAEDAYSVKNIEDTSDDDILTPAEHGFMQGYVM